MLSLAVKRPNVFCTWLRSLAMRPKRSLNCVTDWVAMASNWPTEASRAASTPGVRRFCTSPSRCCKASTSSLRRAGLSSRSSCK